SAGRRRHLSGGTELRGRHSLPGNATLDVSDRLSRDADVAAGFLVEVEAGHFERDLCRGCDGHGAWPSVRWEHASSARYRRDFVYVLSRCDYWTDQERIGSVTEPIPGLTSRTTRIVMSLAFSSSGGPLGFDFYNPFHSGCVVVEA